MRKLFVVIHENPDTEDFKIVGIYSSRERAEAGIARARELAGFKAKPQGFSVNEYELDRDEWRQGFETIPYHARAARS